MRSKNGGVGGDGEECEPQDGEVVSGEAEVDAAAGDEAESDEAGSNEAEDAQALGSGADTPGDQEICSLPPTGTGSNSDMPSMLSVFAALAAVTAAGFGPRQRIIW